MGSNAQKAFNFLGKSSVLCGRDMFSVKSHDSIFYVTGLELGILRKLKCFSLFGRMHPNTRKLLEQS